MTKVVDRTTSPLFRLTRQELVDELMTLTEMGELTQLFRDWSAHIEGDRGILHETTEEDPSDYLLVEQIALHEVARLLEQPSETRKLATVLNPKPHRPA